MWSYLLRLFDTKECPGFDWLESCPPLKKENIVWIGLRSVDEFEKKIIKEHNLNYYCVDKILDLGIN